MRTLLSVSPTSTSLKWKSVVLSLSAVSSSVVSEIASAVGPSFTAVTVILSVLSNPVLVL